MLTLLKNLQPPQYSWFEYCVVTFAVWRLIQIDNTIWGLLVFAAWCLVAIISLCRFIRDSRQ